MFLGYILAVILYIQFMVPVILFPMFNICNFTLIISELLLLFFTTFTQGICNYMPEINHVSRVHSCNYSLYTIYGTCNIISHVKCLYFYIATFLITFVIIIIIIITIIIYNKEFNWTIIFHVTFKWKHLHPSLLTLNFSVCRHAFRDTSGTPLPACGDKGLTPLPPKFQRSNPTQTVLLQEDLY